MLKRAVDIVSSLPGEIGLYILNTATCQEASFHADQPLEAASVIKIPIMVEAFRQKEAGLIDFDAPVSIQQEDKLPSCGALTYLHDGVTVSVGDLVTLMIILSDNTATNLLIDRLGSANINLAMNRLGLMGTTLNRKLFQPELSRQGIQNYVTAHDVGALLKAMLEGTLISAEASKKMLEILGNQRLNGKMPFFLHDQGIKCAHKTGEDDGITHDVGIIFADSPIIFCFLSNHTNVPRSERAIQDIAALIAGVKG